MATKTDAQVITLTLQKTFLLEGNETASGEDNAAMEQMLASRIEYLRDEEVCFWADGQCPLQCFDPLAEYLSYYVPLLPMSERAAYKQASIDGLRELRKMASTSNEGAATRAEFF